MERLKLKHNKLHRKLKRAKRLGEPYDHLLPRLNELDDQLSAGIEGWVKRTYLNG